MPPHKHAGDYKCRAMAQAVKEYINAFPLHERKAAITALFEKTQDEREAFLAERVAAIREAAQGKGWQCYPCTPETCPTQKRGWKKATIGSPGHRVKAELSDEIIVSFIFLGISCVVVETAAASILKSRV